MALRGHASIQGSTDIPTLYNILPGYIPMPHAARARQTSATFIEPNTSPSGFWGNMRRLHRRACSRRGGATPRPPSNDFCFDYLPRITGDHSIYPTVARTCSTARCKGFFVIGENPAVGSANSGLHRRAMANARLAGRSRPRRDRDARRSGTTRPRSRRGELRTEEIGTEVFFLPAAAHTEKDGIVHEHAAPAAVAPQGGRAAGRLPLRAVVLLPPRPRSSARSWRRSTERARPARSSTCTWDYPTDGRHRRAERRGGAARDQRLGRRTARRSRRYTELKDDGSTACGCWIYCGCFAGRDEPARPPQARSRADLGRAGVGLGVAGEPPHPLQPRVRRPRRAGRGRSARATSGGTSERAKWTGDDVPDFSADKRPDYRPPTDATAEDAIAGARSVHHAGRRPRLAVRARRPRRRTAARRTTSRTSRRSRTRSTASSRTRRASASTGPATAQPTRGERDGVPVRR